jgi:hypothetical protein
MCARLSAFLAVIFFSPYISAQNVIEGRLVKSQGNTPIAYANIGILNTSIGTISNANGSFSLRVPEEHLDDSVLFSALGFEKRSFHARSLLDQKDVTVQLAEQVVVLRDVIVSGIKTVRQTAEFGNRHWDAGSIYTDSVAAGSAMALLIENKYPAYNPDISPPYYLGKVKLRISKNTLDEFKIRVRVYEYDSLTGLPGRDLFHESLIITSNISKGWLEADLAPFNVRVEGRTFFLAFEWILDDEARSTILNQYREFKRMFPDKVSVDTMRVGGEKIVYNSWHGFVAGTSFGSASKRFYVDHYKSYYRSNSYGAWKRASFILTAQVMVSNQPIERKRKKMNKITD